MENVRKHYNDQKMKNVTERMQTEAYLIRRINNNIKYKLIDEYLPSNAFVLDLAAGKGGDLYKYAGKTVKLYYGLDISNLSLLEVAERYKKRPVDYICRFKIQDCFGVHFDLETNFDFISCQFSFHYAFYSRETALTAISNVIKHMAYKSYFVMTVPMKSEICKRFRQNNYKNSLYGLKASTHTLKAIKENAEYDDNKIFGLAYKFNLKDSIEDCEEYMVDDRFIKEQFKKKGCELVEHISFENFCKIHGGNHHKNNLADEYYKLTDVEKEVVSLYQIFIFQRL